MESVILVAPCVYIAKFKSRIHAKFHVDEGGAGGMVIDDGKTTIYILQDDSIRDDLAQEQIDLVSTMQDPIFYAPDFVDIDFCREVLTMIADDPAILVDNDHGIMMVGSEFVRMIKSQLDWDWRRDRL